MLDEFSGDDINEWAASISSSFFAAATVAVAFGIWHLEIFFHKVAPLNDPWVPFVLL